MVFQIEWGREREREGKGGGPKGRGVSEVAQDGVPNQVQCSETVSLCSVLFFCSFLVIFVWSKKWLDLRVCGIFFLQIIRVGRVVPMRVLFSGTFVASSLSSFLSWGLVWLSGSLAIIWPRISRECCVANCRFLFIYVWHRIFSCSNRGFQTYKDFWQKNGGKKKEKKRKEILAFTFIKSCVLIILARICTSRSLDLGLVVEQGL